MESKDEIMEEQASRPMKWQMLSAAAILVLFTFTTVMRFYSRSVTSEAGELTEINLPDGSLITLNSHSVIKYNPMWWYIDRRVELEGEAFFKVVKEGGFEVVSDGFITSVMGTSFNVLSGEGRYEVACAGGSVRVLSLSSGTETFLTAGQKAIADGEGGFLIEADDGAALSAEWLNNFFYFTSARFTDVFCEIERQYGIEIVVDTLVAGDEEMTFTGYFPKANKVEDVLDLVCIPFGIRYKKTGEGIYNILPGENQE